VTPRVGQTLPTEGRPAHAQTGVIGRDGRNAGKKTVAQLPAVLLQPLLHPCPAGDWVLVHAAAGGTGQLLTQVCRQLGARIIGTTSTQAKAAVAK
jgi:NADPH2:quinone reductase